ncbi:MAG: hypothetical protein J6B68_11265 [Lachnospiraceae bacterium]|nr:hypothetical protein [Lachnospiraceae bacterium]
MKRKKNRFLLFCISWLPGCGEMYLGFMKRGVSLLTLFSLGMMVAIITNMGVLSLIPVILWAYSFFEANNLGGLPDEEFHRVEDKYMFGLDSMEMDSIKNSLMGKYRKGLAIVLILLGINLLWNVICDILYDIFYMFELSDYFYEITSSIGNGVTRVAIGVAIIWFGVKLIKGKKVELEEAEKVEEIGDGK